MRWVLRITTLVVTFLITSEIALRIYNPFPFRVRGDRIVLPVHQRYTITHAGTTRLDPVTHVVKNSVGFRGPEPPRDWSRWFTIVAVGGSTTECLFLSDGRTWTDQLARRAAAVRRDVWINNAGLEGHSTFGHLVLLRQVVITMRPTIAIFLIGNNDMKLATASRLDEALNPQNLSRTHRALTFAAAHSETGAVAENLIRMARTFRANMGDGVLSPAEMSVRRHVEAAEGAALLAEHRVKYLDGYARRVAEMVETSRRYGIEPVLATQPALFGDGVD